MFRSRRWRLRPAGAGLRISRLAKYSQGYEAFVRKIRQAGEQLSAAHSRARQTEVGKALLRGSHHGRDESKPVAKQQAKPADDTATQQFLQKVDELAATEKVSRLKAFDEARRRFPPLAKAMNQERGGISNDAA